MSESTASEITSNTKTKDRNRHLGMTEDQLGIFAPYIYQWEPEENFQAVTVQMSSMF